MKKTQQQACKGFTLIELLVVVLIIGILSAVALPQYRKAVFKARLSEADVILNTYQKGITSYLLANGGYPGEQIYFTGANATGGLDMETPATSSEGRYDANGFLKWGVTCTNSNCSMNVSEVNDMWSLTIRTIDLGKTWAWTPNVTRTEDWKKKVLCQWIKSKDENLSVNGCPN